MKVPGFIPEVLLEGPALSGPVWAGITHRSKCPKRESQ